MAQFFSFTLLICKMCIYIIFKKIIKSPEIGKNRSILLPSRMGDKELFNHSSIFILHY